MFPHQTPCQIHHKESSASIIPVVLINLEEGAFSKYPNWLFYAQGFSQNIEKKTFCEWNIVCSDFIKDIFKSPIYSRIFSYDVIYEKDVCTNRCCNTTVVGFYCLVINVYNISKGNYVLWCKSLGKMYIILVYSCVFDYNYWL